jgi:translation initiation factor IF-3
LNINPRFNNQIRSLEVRVIDENDKQLGIMKTQEAINLARERGLDLVEVSAKSLPPVCRIVEMGKFLYRKEKLARQHKGHRVEVKNIRLSFNIAKHDLEMKANQAQKFLEKGDRVRVQIVLRGREKAFRDLARKKLQEFTAYIKIPIIFDQPPTKEPRGFYMLLSKGK